MDFNVVQAMLPEIFLALLTCSILVIGLFFSKKNNPLYFYLSQITLIFILALLFQQFPIAPKTFLEGLFLQDNFAISIKILLVGFMMGIFMLGKNYLLERNLAKMEFFVLMLFSLLGMMCLASSGNVASFYLALECFALPIYALIVYQDTLPNSIEAGLKYFVMGAIGSGLFLFGASWLYGITGALEFREIAQHLAQAPVELNAPIVMSLFFILAGLLFKLGCVPFHFWVPDVYEGAPTVFTLMLASVAKITAFAMLYRVISLTFIEFANQWQFVLKIVALLSIGLGNLVAIVQDNIKRLLGYSTISHMGGVLFANMILASALLFFPWQQCFIYIAIFILVLSIVTGIFVRNTPDNAQRPIEHIDRSLLKDLKRTLKDPRFWLLGTYCGICYTVITVYAALWSNPFLVKAHRLTNYQSTVATALIYLGLAIGSPLLTWLFGHHPKRHAIMIIAPLVLCGLLSLLIYLQNLPMIILFSLNLLLGLCSGVLILSYTLTAEIAPSNAKSTCLGFLNTLALGTAPCFQPVIGFILEKQTDVIVNDIEFYTAENYQNALSILPIILALASVVILWFYRVHSNSAQIA